MQQRNRPVFAIGVVFTPVVRVLIWINVLVYLFLNLSASKPFTDSMTMGQAILSLLGLVPSMIQSQWALWQPLTYMFVHQSFFHLLFNMLALWMFGSELEARWSSRSFLKYYLFTGVGAGLVSFLLNIPTIGASGGVFGLLLAYGLMFPNRVLYIYFVIPLKAKYCVLLFGLLEVIALIHSGKTTGINHLAHLSGLFFGALWFLYHMPKNTWIDWLRQYQRKKMRKRFRVVGTELKSNQDESTNNDQMTIH